MKRKNAEFEDYEVFFSGDLDWWVSTWSIRITAHSFADAEKEALAVLAENKSTDRIFKIQLY